MSSFQIQIQELCFYVGMMDKAIKVIEKITSDRYQEVIESQEKT